MFLICWCSPIIIYLIVCLIEINIYFERNLKKKERKKKEEKKNTTHTQNEFEPHDNIYSKNVKKIFRVLSTSGKRNTYKVDNLFHVLV